MIKKKQAPGTTHIGYVSQTFGVPFEKFKTVQLKNATSEKLMELIAHNLNNLQLIMDYNIENDLHMFRIISDVIPFGSHEVNKLPWWELFSEQLELLGEKAVAHNIRLSMHPGQYTVLNSPDAGVVERSIADLAYHTRFLDALKLDASHKIILHVGGVYGDKDQAIARFIKNYQQLAPAIKARLIIENDDRQYTVADVLKIAQEAEIPVVYDNLHHQCNPDFSKSERKWLLEVRKTWKKTDGRQKIHYSQQDLTKRLGAHSQTIDLEEFEQFYQNLPTQDLDIMFEVKDKNLSAIKGTNYLAAPELTHLAKDWAKYQYAVFEHSPILYTQIEALLLEATNYPVLEFYQLIDAALAQPIEPANATKVAQMIWEQTKALSTSRTHQNFEKALAQIKNGGSTRAVKRLLWKLVLQTEEEHLLQSLYFYEVFD